MLANVRSVNGRSLARSLSIRESPLSNCQSWPNNIICYIAQSSFSRLVDCGLLLILHSVCVCLLLSLLLAEVGLILMRTQFKLKAFHWPLTQFPTVDSQPSGESANGCAKLCRHKLLQCSSDPNPMQWIKSNEWIHSKPLSHTEPWSHKLYPL